MKKSIFTVAIILVSLISFAGSAKTFKKEMKQNLEILRSSNDNLNYETLGDKFTEIAKHNSDRFEPLYFSAFCYITDSWSVEDKTEKLALLEKAKKQIEKAAQISPNNSEILVLEALCYQAQILIDPAKYGQSYSAKANTLLKKAQEFEKSNPRAQFLLAQNIYYRPAQYGGGAKVALPMFEKAEVLFSKQNNSNYMNPLWGADLNKEMIQLCEK